MAKHRGKAQIKDGQTIRKLKQACAKDAVIDQSGGIVDKSAWSESHVTLVLNVSSSLEEPVHKNWLNLLPEIDGIT